VVTTGISAIIFYVCADETSFRYFQSNRLTALLLFEREPEGALYLLSLCLSLSVMLVYLNHMTWKQGVHGSAFLEQLGVLVARLTQLTMYKAVQQQKELLVRAGADLDIDELPQPPRNVIVSKGPQKQKLVDIYTTEGSTF
jgi:hypothetical protein